MCVPGSIEAGSWKYGISRAPTRTAFLRAAARDAFGVPLGVAVAYVLQACGISTFLLTAFYLIIDVWGFSKWAFFFMVSPLTRPFLLGVTCAPEAARYLTRGAVAASLWFDRRGIEAVALRGMTFIYGMEYFRGMRENAGSLRNSARNLVTYVRRRGKAT